MARVDQSAKKIIQTAPSPTRNLVIILLFIFLSGWLLTATDASRVLLSHSSRLLSSALKSTTDTQDTPPAIPEKDGTVTPKIDDFLDYNDSSDTEKTSNSDNRQSDGTTSSNSQQSKQTTKSPSTSPLPCSESGYCSIDRVETFKGDVGTIDGIQHLIKTTTYKHELVLIAAGHGFGFELAMNLVTSLWKLGLAHIAVLADDGPACDDLHAVYSNVTCIWSTTPGKDDLEASDMQRILLQRILLILRMVRLGVNVFNIDSDAYVYRDPYVYLKSPPFQSQEIVVMRDIWGHAGSNTGAIYAQNIKPDSPSAWFLGEAVDRIIRTLESADWLTEHKPGFIISHAVVDQFVFDDVIGSAYSGQMIAPIGDMHYHDGLPEERRMEIKTATSEIFSWGNAFSQQKSVEYPDSWSELTETDFQDGKLASMSFKIPSALKGSMVDLFDGQPLLPPRKKASQAIMEMLAIEGPMWPDPWTSTTKNNSNNSKNGTFAFAPEFLISAWASRGNGGLWAAAKQVVAHIVFIAIPEWGANSAWKQVALKATRSWNWEVTNAFHPNSPFPGTSTEADPIPRVLALAPGILQYSRSVEEFRHMSVTLAKLASRLGRVLVAPEVPCDDTPWVSSWGAMNVLPWKKRYDGAKVMGFNAEGDADVDKPRCMWLDTIRLACMEHTLLPVDFDYMQRHLLDEEKDEPRLSNTLLFDMYHPLQQDQDGGSSNYISSGGMGMGMGMVARLTPEGFEDLVNQGKKREMADATVVYVGAALEMVEGGSLTNVAWGSRDEERFNGFKDVCKWLEPPQNRK